MCSFEVNEVYVDEHFRYPQQPKLWIFAVTRKVCGECWIAAKIFLAFFSSTSGWEDISKYYAQLVSLLVVVVAPVTDEWHQCSGHGFEAWGTRICAVTMALECGVVMKLVSSAQSHCCHMETGYKMWCYKAAWKAKTGSDSRVTAKFSSLWWLNQCLELKQPQWCFGNSRLRCRCLWSSWGTKNRNIDTCTLRVYPPLCCVLIVYGSWAGPRTQASTEKT